MPSDQMRGVRTLLIDPVPHTVAEVRRKGRPKLEEAVAIERAIRDAALAVLLEHGEAATLNAVAQAAGISRKSLYARYSNRSALFIEVIREAMVDGDTPAFDTSLPIEEGLFTYIQFMLGAVTGKRSLTIQRLLAVDPAYIRALKAEMHASMDRHFFQPLAHLLREASGRGEIVIRDPQITAKLIVHLMFAEGLSIDPGRAAARTETWQDDYARRLTEFVCNGLLPRHAISIK